MKHLLMFTIGPVQPFIENSRKARDLYAGSKLLSELMQHGVCWLNRKAKVEVLFPVLSQAQQTPNIPNRLVALFHGYAPAQLQQVAQALSAQIKQKFLNDSLTLLKKAGIQEDGLVLAKGQLQRFLEIYWLFQPFEDADYASAYQTLFQQLHDVKSVRCFAQTEEPWGRKCMLFPQYNAIFVKKHLNHTENVFPYQSNRDHIYDISDLPYFRYRVKENEALSAIAMIKRAYNKSEANIYSIRQMLLRSRVPPNILETAEQQSSESGWMDDVANVVYDLDHGTAWEEGAYPEEAVRAARGLYEQLQRQGISLSAYYAVIKFDGDSMGEQFRRLNTSAEQQALSQKISAFAYEAPKIFSRYFGLPVFAGGEDFLGFLPLDSLFCCMNDLQKQFHQMLGLTFSAGISVAHVMQPLKEVMAQADQMEEAAKQAEGKNAFAIGIIKRSGTTVRIPAYHFVGGGDQPVLADVWELVRLLKDSGCSKSLFYHIAMVMDFFVREDTCPEEGMMEALLRSCIASAHVDGTLVSREVLLQKLLLLFRACGNGNDFLNTLDGIAFFSREVGGCSMK